MVALIMLSLGIFGSLGSIIFFLISYAFDEDEKEKSGDLKLKSIIGLVISMLLIVTYVGIVSVQAGYDCNDVCDPYISMIHRDVCYCKTTTGWDQISGE